VVVLVLSVLIKLWQAGFYRTVGRRISSMALRASATDSISDVFSTGAVLVSTIIAWKTGLLLDAYMGFVVALIIIWSGIKMIREILSPILGEAPDQDMVEKIDHMIEGYDGVLGMHDLMVHSYGPGSCFASVHVEVDAKEDILKSHDMIDNIEREVNERLGIQLVIHHDPVVTDDPESNELHEFVSGVVAGIDNGVGMHDFRLVRGPTHTNLIFDVVVPCGWEGSHSALVDDIAARIKQRDQSLYAVITVDSSYISKNMPMR
ncbi:MAG: cation diffusion facilitator family transporter, partial [Acetanaerobacterium sp.]